jgi:hypothetical protein
MTGNPDGLRSLAKYSKLPVERIRYVPDVGEQVVRAITRGVLFQMAFWSGPAVLAFAKLTEVIAKLDPDGRLELVVVDIDGSEALSAERPRPVRHHDLLPGEQGGLPCPPSRG